MDIPWYLKPDWLLHAEMLEEQERLSATSSSRGREQDKEIEKLKKRISELEAQLLALEKYLSEQGILPPKPEEPEASEKSTVPMGEPVTFPARTDKVVACPRCGKRQQGNRSACYSCQTPFQYENE